MCVDFMLSGPRSLDYTECVGLVLICVLTDWEMSDLVVHIGCDIIECCQMKQVAVFKDPQISLGLVSKRCLL